MGNDKSHIINPYWDAIKEQIMKEGLLAKFTQHPNLEKLLIDTLGKKLIEKSKTDSYWGCGRDGRGRNRLGFLLMQVRQEIKDWRDEINNDTNNNDTNNNYTNNNDTNNNDTNNTNNNQITDISSPSLSFSIPLLDFDTLDTMKLKKKET